MNWLQFHAAKHFDHLAVLLHRVLVGLLVVKVAEDPITDGVKSEQG